MAKKSFRQALNEALKLEMRRDDSIIVIGEDITGGKGSNVFLFADPVSADGSDPLKFRWISGKGEAVSLS